jgi:hypothetical protein
MIRSTGRLCWSVGWRMLKPEGIVQTDLQKRSHRLYLEPAAMAGHVDFSLFSSLLPGKFHGGLVAPALVWLTLPVCLLDHTRREQHVRSV